MTNPDYEWRPRWEHRDGDRYVQITANVVGNPTEGFEITHTRQSAEFMLREAAWQDGIRNLDRGDDFNLGAIRDGRLTAILWATEIVDDDPGLMAEIAQEVGLT